MVSAWPEPPPAMSAEKSAGVRDGMGAFRSLLLRRHRTAPGEHRAAFKRHWNGRFKQEGSDDHTSFFANPIRQLVGRSLAGNRVKSGGTMHKLITALVATLTILLAGSIVGKAEAMPRPIFPLTKSYTPTEKVAYYHRYARRHYRRGYYGYGYGYGYHRPYYGYGYRRPYYGYGYGRRWRY